MRKLWLARDKDGEIYLYSLAPKKEDSRNRYIVDEDASEDKDCIFFADEIADDDNNYAWNARVRLSEDAFPEVTWEKSPVELTVNLETKK